MPCSLQTFPDVSLEVDLPLIDLSRFAQTSHDAHYQEVIAKVKDACQELGFFRVVSHGIPQTLLQDVESAIQQLCAMPAEAKERSSTNDPMDSYASHNGLETFLLSHSETVVEMSRKIWPEDGNPLFCKTVGTYMLLLADLALTITKTILASLDLDVQHFYESDFQNCTYAMRISHYTSDGKSIEEEALIPHTDSGLLTILYTGKEGGLQIRSKEGKWLDVKPQPDSFVINIADCFKAWSNGRLRSAEHRVVQKGWTDRISLACGVHFPGEKEIWAPPELVDDNYPRRYRPFNVNQFRRAFFDNTNPKEKASRIDKYAGL